MKSLFLLFFIIGTSAIAQNSTSINWVENHLGSQRYIELSATNPGLISDLHVKAEFGFELIDMIPEKIDDFKPISEIKLNGKEEISLTTADFVNQWENNLINPLTIDIPQSNTENIYLHLVGTDKALIVYSTEAARKRKK